MANTISDLKALAVTSSGMEVEVLGYHAVADGGGGLFAWRAGATATDDGGLWIESTVATGGLWQRIVDSAAPVSVRWWGARGDGSTDDTAAIQAALDAGFSAVHLPTGTYPVSATLTVPAGTIVTGDGSGAFRPANARTTIVKTNGDTAGDAVMETGQSCTIRDLKLQPHNEAAVTYERAVYPTGTGNTSIGLRTGSANTVEDVVSQGFADSALVLGTTTKVMRCHIFRSRRGITTSGSDGMITNSVTMFCHEAGILLTTNYWIVTGCRIEWNATYGIQSNSGEHTFTANLFDRNGWAGLYLNGGWGNVVSGNYFSRNGAGGDGSMGRWNWAVPGHNAYLAPPTVADSCHIKIYYQRDCTIIGNRYRAGVDDGGSGAMAPAYVYNMDGTAGVTSNITIFANAGEAGSGSGFGGYAASYPGGSGVFGGTDTSAQQLVYGRPVRLGSVTIPGMSTPRQPYGLPQAASVDVPIGGAIGGRIKVWTNSWNSTPSYAEVTFARASGSATTATVAIDNVIGTNVSTAAISTDPAVMTVTFPGTRFYNVSYDLHTM
ncbi:glycosyl hydrolase family 28-related protein [Tistrella mobilis]|uniref:glycosyl hydrolase family 28-related protein n=1 Tax=Tistrella mobilis TaxID=171437 RepID=UPI0035589992